MEHSMLKDVTSASQQWTVRVRVTRFNESFSADDPEKPVLIDLVLIDEEGTMMEGQVPERRIAFFKSKIQEDAVYYISFFHVCDARTQYRPVEHEYMMRFTPHTKVYEVSVILPNFPRYACKIASYQTLRDRVKSTKEYCSDAIGIFTGCSPVRQQNTRRGVKPLREVYLTDGRENAVVALWDQHAAQFDADRLLNLGQQDPVVLLFVGLTCQLYSDKLSLQSSTCCRWYENPDLPEVAALRDSCPRTMNVPSLDISVPPQTTAEHISVTELAKLDNPHIIYSNRYITDVKIKSLVPNRPWWYPACELCHKTLTPNGDSTICKNKKCSGIRSEPRYRLAIFAVDPSVPQPDDESVKIELVVFGPKAQELIGTPVQTLIATDNSGGSSIPAQITTLYGKCFQMRLSVSSYSMQADNIIYQIDAILGISSATPSVSGSVSQSVLPAHVAAQPGDKENNPENLSASAPDPRNTPVLPENTSEDSSATASDPDNIPSLTASQEGHSIEQSTPSTPLVSVQANAPRTTNQKRSLEGDDSKKAERSGQEKTEREVRRKLDVEKSCN